ncbi:MAG: DUF1778 domain-containing protein [Gemmatimonadota bacterium]|nr:DUF1778 domain-containing protein [Gemmatimonadota bacterium]MDH3422210.1 DUF1778 domain-containing protein [Gemmatimonadota bacterium]
MGTRTSQLQIRVTPEEKDALKRLASASGVSVSSYVLDRVLPSAQLDLARMLEDLAQVGVDHRATLSEFERTLERVGGPELAATIPAPDPGSLSPVLQNYVAALVESEANRKAVEAPEWVRSVRPLEVPHFAWTLRSLRPHQVRTSPVPFKRRNLFFDPAGGPSP